MSTSPLREHSSNFVAEYPQIQRKFFIWGAKNASNMQIWNTTFLRCRCTISTNTKATNSFCKVARAEGTWLSSFEVFCTLTAWVPVTWLASCSLWNKWTVNVWCETHENDYAQRLLSYIRDLALQVCTPLQSSTAKCLRPVWLWKTSLLPSY